MSTCFDVYVLPSGCSTIYAYPSAIHPTPPSAGGGGSKAKPYIGEPPSKRKKKEDDLWVILLHQNLLD